MALGTSGGLRPLPRTPAAAGRGVLPAAQTPASAWRRCTTGASTPLRHRKWCRTSSWRSSGGRRSTSPLSSPTTPTSRATWTTSRPRSRRTGRDTPSTLRGTACRMAGPRGSQGANAVPAGSGGPRGYTRPPTLSFCARRGHQNVLANSRRARNMPRGALPRPGVRNPSGWRLGPPHTQGPGRPGSGALQPHRVPQGSPRPTTVPIGQHCHAAHRQATTPRHVPPDGAAHDAVAWAPRATPPLPRQRRSVAHGVVGMPRRMRR